MPRRACKQQTMMSFSFTGQAAKSARRLLHRTWIRSSSSKYFTHVCSVCMFGVEVPCSFLQTKEDVVKSGIPVETRGTPKHTRPQHQNPPLPLLPLAFAKQIIRHPGRAFPLPIVTLLLLLLISSLKRTVSRSVSKARLNRSEKKRKKGFLSNSSGKDRCRFCAWAGQLNVNIGYPTPPPHIKNFSQPPLPETRNPFHPPSEALCTLSTVQEIPACLPPFAAAEPRLPDRISCPHCSFSCCHRYCHRHYLSLILLSALAITLASPQHHTGP